MIHRRVMALLAVLVAACGGSAAMTSPATQATTPADADSAESVRSEQNTSRPQAPEVAGARHELDDAEGRLNAAQNDCAAACRALASMERAAEHLCALESGTECGHARDRVEAARERVRAHCGGCAQ